MTLAEPDAELFKLISKYNEAKYNFYGRGDDSRNMHLARREINDLIHSQAERRASEKLDQFIKMLSNHEHDISFDCEDGSFYAYEIDSHSLIDSKVFNSLEELEANIKEQ